MLCRTKFAFLSDISARRCMGYACRLTYTWSTVHRTTNKYTLVRRQQTLVLWYSAYRKARTLWHLYAWGRGKLLPDATRGNFARYCVVGDRQTDTFGVSRHTHHDINHNYQNETARKCRRCLRKDANKERPSVRQINRKTSTNNIKLNM